jgi:hypothetical protein
MKPLKCESHLGSIEPGPRNELIGISDREDELPSSFHSKLLASTDMLHETATLTEF